MGPAVPLSGSGTIPGLPGAVHRRRGGGRRGFALRAAARFVARPLGGDVGLGLTDHELFLGLAGAAGELRKLVGAEDEDRDAHDGGDFYG